MDLTTGTWSFNRELTQTLRNLANEQWIFNVEQYIYIVGTLRNSTNTSHSTVWRFEIDSQNLTRYDNAAFHYSSLQLPSYHYNSGVVVMQQFTQILANQISSDKFFSLTIDTTLIGTSSLPEKTFVFDKSGYYIIDWPSENSTRIDQIDIYFTFGGPAYAVYCQTLTATTSNMCLFTTGNSQATCSAMAISGINQQLALGSTKNLLWSDTNIYLYDSSTHTVTPFAETFQSVSKVLLYGNNFFVFDTQSSGTILMHTYTYVSGNTFDHTSSTAAWVPNAIVGSDFISTTAAVVGLNLNTQDSVALSLSTNGLSAFSNDYFFSMKQQSDKTFFSQIDVYSLEARRWEELIIPPFTFTTFGYTRAAVLDNHIVMWFETSLCIYDLSSGEWTENLPAPVDVFAEPNDALTLEWPVIIINSTALLRAQLEKQFYWFQLPNNWTSIDPALLVPDGNYLYQYYVHNDVIYVISNNTAAELPYSQIFYYNLNDRSWENLILPVGQTTPTVMALVNNSLAFLGDKLLQTYHIPTKTWSQEKLSQTVIFSTVLVTEQGTAIAAGGTLNDEPTDIVYILTDDGIEPDVPLTAPSAGSRPSSSVTSPSTDTPGVSSLSTGELAAAIVVPIGVAAIAGVLIAVLLIRRNKRRRAAGAITMTGLEAKYSEWYTPFNDITFGQQLGQGASGQVFEGTWKSTKVALKVSSTQANQTVIQELELMIKLRPHPNVVQLFGFSVHPETHSAILILELCNQGSLDSTLYDTKKDWSMKQKLTWLVGISKGLSHLHANNIVHRDVAARNVLLHQGEAKITDFGMSRLIDEQKQHGTTKSELGPIRWMAPESIKVKQYSSKSGKPIFAKISW